jgi:serine/threonine-protein kinase
MSPEQARGEPDVDHRSDVWALAVVLYEAITGRPAFDGDNYNAVMRAIIEASVVPSWELAAGDVGLWRIIERGLRKDRTERFQTMREFGKALAEWLVEHGADTDVTGEPVASFLDVSDPEAPRDILSVPPAPMSPTPPRGVLAEGSATLKEFPPGPTLRPTPHSMSGAVLTPDARRGRQGTSLAVVTALVAGFVLTLAVALLSRSAKPERVSTAASSEKAIPMPSVRAPEPAPVEQPAPPAAPPVVAPEPAATTSPRKSAAPPRAMPKAAVRKSALPKTAPVPTRVLKNPY